MNPPKFLFAPDAKSQELYIVHTMFPITILWVRQSIPAQLFVAESEFDTDEVDENGFPYEPEERQQFERVLNEAAEWYRANSLESTN